ncbi:MAG: serine hydrolase, partial [Bacteroidota bacterium]|nr:serine hydrolase [Bacteroidota bacterium]
SNVLSTKKEQHQFISPTYKRQRKMALKKINCFLPLSDKSSRQKKDSLSIPHSLHTALQRRKQKPIFRQVLPVLFAFVFSSTVSAQDLTGEIDRIFSWATPASPGCVCAVSKDGKMVVNRAYGSADLERNVPLNESSIFDAGSLVKQFVAAATLLLVEEGKLSLSDDVRKYIPELPDYGEKITINHLLTHTSGIRDWTGILPLTAGKDDALTVILRQRGLNFKPGEEWSYSNSGYVLLKEIISRTSGTTFGAFAQKRLFAPLGMKATAYRIDMREIIPNRALAYDKERGAWKMAMLLDNDRGGGGALLSTAADLLTWNDALTSGKLGRFVTEKMHEPATLTNNRKLSYTRGLFMDSIRGTQFWRHSGSADGYKSLLARFPEQGLSIALLCNSGDETDRVSFALRIFNLFAPATDAQATRSTQPPIAIEGVDAATLDLNSRAGVYFSEATSEPLTLAVDRGRLRVAGGPALVAQSKDRFKRWGNALEFMSADAFDLQFLSPERFELRSMEGRKTTYRRARAFAPGRDSLKVFAGRFGSDEIGAVIQIEQKGDALLMRLEHTPSRSAELKPIDTDTFQVARMLLRFRRDKAGKVVGFYYNNPMIRNVQFTRLNEQASRR